MLDMNLFMVSQSRLFNCMEYYGENHYYIFQYPNQDYLSLVVAKLDSAGNEELETNKRLACSSLSIAIASIEAMERGEEI